MLLARSNVFEGIYAAVDYAHLEAVGEGPGRDLTNAVQ